MTLSAADVERHIALLDSAERSGVDWRAPLGALKSELARGRQQDTWMRRGAFVLAAAIAIALRGRTWDFNDLLPFIAAVLAFNAIAGFILNRIVPATAREDRIKALAAHFEGERPLAHEATIT